MKKNLLALLLVVLSVSAMAEKRYPVDAVIDGMRFKANHLELFKNFLLKNTCAVSVNGNRVLLGAGAMRSEALVIGIAPENPGNYAAFDKAPKPQFLARVLNSKDPFIVASRFVFDQKDEVYGVFFRVAKPYDANSVTPNFPETFYVYKKAEKVMKLSDYGSEGKRAEFENSDGDKIVTECTPK